MAKYGILMAPDDAEKCHLGTQTLTRRLIKPQPPEGITGVTETVVDEKRTWCFERQLPDGEWDFWHARPPYFRHDVVAVKEPHWRWGRYERNEKGNWRFVPFCNEPALFDPPVNKPKTRTTLGWHKRPSMFLPYDLARTYWEILSVRPERLQDITDADLLAEGICPLEPDDTDPWDDEEIYYIPSFADLWDSINPKKASWESNPWVWRYEGEKVTL